MLKQERLLPGTDALPRSTVEVQHYGRSLLVRSRDATGSTTQHRFATPTEAMLEFWQAADQLQHQARECARRG